MRVNMDSSIAIDSRFKLVALALDIKWTEVIGSCFLVWLMCYERRSTCLRKVEADLAAELSGFSDALIDEDLADDMGDGVVRIHGVEERIKFLLKQAESGSKGGKSKGKKKPKQTLKKKQASAQAPACESAQANTPTPTPDLSPTPDQDLSLDLDPDLTDTEAPVLENEKRSHRLPQSWEPTEAHAVKAAEDGLDLEDARSSFRDYHEAKGSTMKNWDAAFRTWLRNAKKFQDRDAAKQPSSPPEKML